MNSEGFSLNKSWKPLLQTLKDHHPPPPSLRKSDFLVLNLTISESDFTKAPTHCSCEINPKSSLFRANHPLHTAPSPIHYLALHALLGGPVWGCYLPLSLPVRTVCFTWQFLLPVAEHLYTTLLHSPPSKWLLLPFWQGHDVPITLQYLQHLFRTNSTPHSNNITGCQTTFFCQHHCFTPHNGGSSTPK
jgi:hypothetical protein